MKRMYITGYRSFELGIFQDKDPKITIIKNVLKNRIIAHLELGLEWVIIGGNLGTEFWASQVVVELQADYPELKYSVIFPFEEFGANWNESNQQSLISMKTLADYVNATSHMPYSNPSQLKNHTQFILNHTDGCLLLYDEEFEGKTMFFLKDSRRFQEGNEYEIDTITMDDLQNYEIY
ncbi:DUF1273 domain-containing protein [Vagococcus salmoninarum]|uniref:UPF0398 protein CBF35_02125 n=1 Tax=Vagococcus salmoninarum TaxID=2739 RepID=A0A429ZUX5_9ENTE|nr:DUF1273 domain-containing protein [Vagococcus salmoninarum]MBE9388045.1 DUF1273 domain-containing protein [Vagococcus salmoninarum]RST97485.1 hypothetical protein CBF35_02125 [Vagococcus salmoninarum]